MGGIIEINDTLQITTEQGFPKEIKEGVTFEDVKDKFFSFSGKPGARLFQVAPNRNFLVQNIEGKWLYWGKIIIVEQTIRESSTSGKFKVIQLYSSEYQKEITKNESPEGMSYF